MADPSRPLEDDLLPEFDVSDTVARAVAAEPEVAWEALLAVDLIELGRRRPLVGVLGAARAAPELLQRLVRGRGLPPRPQAATLRSLAASGAAADGDWTLLAEHPGRAIALGLVGRFWKPIIEYRRITADTFGEFDEPGWAKTVYSLSVEPIGPGRCQLRGTMRTATTDAAARRRFARYWTLGVGSGAHLLVAALLEAAREAAEPRFRVGGGG
jgi:hypothetical protein